MATTVPATDPSAAPPLAVPVRVQLSVMMFLQFAVWGAWFVVFFPYLRHLNFSGEQAGALIGNMALGAILASLFAGFVADRFVDARILTAGCHLLGAGALYLIAQTQDPGQYNTLFALTLGYAILYNPTLVLTNAITFRHVPDATRDFPGVRVFGTLGWIVVGFLIDFLFFRPLVGPDGAAVMTTAGKVAADMGFKGQSALLLAAVLSAVLGAYCLTLPKTPPTGKAGDAVPIVRALRLFRDPSFAVFFAVSFAITIALAFYYTVTSDFLGQRAGRQDAASTMAIGQVCELILLPLLPLFLYRFGMKWVLALGMLCWGLRYVCFSQAGPAGGGLALAYLGVALHGLCFDFFFAAGFIYCDNEAPRDIRASAQALFSFLTYGVGMWLGSLVCGRLVDAYTLPDKTVEWDKFWLVPAVGVLACLVVFVLCFRLTPRRQVEVSPTAVAPDLADPRM